MKEKTEMEGVREYCENKPVIIGIVTEDDLISWLKKNKPELLGGP